MFFCALYFLKNVECQHGMTHRNRRYYRHTTPFHRIHLLNRFFILILLFLAINEKRFAICEDLAKDAPPLTLMSLEELMNIEITSVSKKPQALSDAAAAIFVITQEDIRRSGISNIPEALRMVPGLQVARIDSNKWAVSSRGFNDFFANKLLVLIDGRSVYTPLFSGVFWDVQDVLLEDVDRIEVIRGPGAALWGANAVNGVINIITKNAKETQGGLLTSTYGKEEKGIGGMRYGGNIGEDSYYRIYGKYFNRDAYVDEKGDTTADDWHASRGGFRIDSTLSDQDTLTVQSDIYEGKSGLTFLSPSVEKPYSQYIDTDEQVSGAHILSRWKKIFSESSDLALQLYYDWNQRESLMFHENRHTFDIDFQHHYQLGSRQDFLWGLGYRFSGDDIENSFMYSFDPSNRDDHLFNGFIQDEISLIDEQLKLTLGSKFEQNDYSGFEIQPNARLSWTPHANHTFWASISRAVRTPSRGDYHLQANFEFPIDDPRNPFPLPIIVNAEGNTDFVSETLLAYELGYRVLIHENLSLDTALFYNDYDHLRTGELVAPIQAHPWIPGHLFVSLYGDNKMEGETYGFEVAADYRFTNWWTLHTTYSFLQMQLHPDQSSNDLLLEAAEGESPHHQFSLRSSMDLTKTVELDSWFRFVDNLPSFDIQSYFSFDVRLGWHPKDNLELSIGAQHLFQNRHPEFRIRSGITEIERNVYAKITWKF